MYSTKRRMLTPLTVRRTALTSTTPSHLPRM